MLGETVRERHGKNWAGAGTLPTLPSQKPQIERRETESYPRTWTEPGLGLGEWQLHL